MEYSKIIAISGSYGSFPSTGGFNQESPETKSELFSRVYGLERRGNEYFLHPLQVGLVPDLTLELSYANQHNVRFGDTLEFWRFDETRALRLIGGKQVLENLVKGNDEKASDVKEAA